MKVVSGSGAAADQRLRLGLQPQRLRARHLGRRRQEVRRRVQERRADRQQVGPARVRARTTIYPVDLNYSDLGTVMPAGGGGYWIISSDIRTGSRPTRTAWPTSTCCTSPARPAPTPEPGPHAGQRRPSTIARPTWRRTAAARCSPPGRRRPRPATSRRRAAGRQMWLQVLDATTGMPPGRLDGDFGGPPEAVAQRARQPLPGLPRVSRRQRRLPGARIERHEDQDPARPSLQLTCATAGSW